MVKKDSNKEKKITINGYLEEVELEDGNSGVVINDGEDDYYVVMDKTGKKLLDHIDEEVELTGVLSKNRGELMIAVTHYHLVDDYEDMDDLDDDFEDRWSA